MISSVHWERIGFINSVSIISIDKLLMKGANIHSLMNLPNNGGNFVLRAIKINDVWK